LSSLYWFFRHTFFVFFKVFNRFRVTGHENVPGTGGVIVAANHASYLDPLVVGAALKRRATYMAKEGLFRIPLIGEFVRSFSFPVRRDRPQPSTIKEAVRRLKKGELIVMFPEGGRSIGGSMLDAKRGVAVIAALSRAPIVPALVSGTDLSLPVGGKLLRPAKITVTFGKPLQVGSGETDKEYQERISRDIMDTVKKLKVESEE
jgi:1-acyl-sn-glycerol-3-phosphate acyltransferase